MSGRCSARRGRRHGALGLLVAVVVLASACGGGKATSPTSTTSNTTSPTSTTITTAPAGANAFEVYLVRREKLMAAGRTASESPTPEIAVRSLLAGPQGTLERDLGMTTEIPAATTLHAVTVRGNVATVDISRSFESGGGSQSMQARAAQVVFTVTQFPGVEQVRFELDGVPVVSIGGEGVMVDRVGRSAFPNVTPAILVESPTPGAVVRSPLHVRGIANTFEATVNYTITDPDGLILHEGYATATAGTGTWGSFAFDVSFTPKRAGIGSLIVYQVSPKDGSHTDIMEIPLQMQL